jgi:hypothetical protein
VVKVAMVPPLAGWIVTLALCTSAPLGSCTVMESVAACRAGRRERKMSGMTWRILTVFGASRS